jgi:hypothetical protein
MKRKQILAFGLIAAFLVISASIPLGYSKPIPMGGYMYVIMPSHSYCEPISGNTCWVNPGTEAEDCDRCCTNGLNFYQEVNDRYGCGCCTLNL